MLYLYAAICVMFRLLDLFILIWKFSVFFFQVPNLLTDLNRSLAELGQPCETEMEKKSRFDEISRLMGNRLRQLLDGLSRFDDPYEMFLNSNTQELLNNYRNVFFETQKSIFTQEFKTQIKQSLCKFLKYQMKLILRLNQWARICEYVNLTTPLSVDPMWIRIIHSS